jgi:hypothetical protein
MNHMTQVIDSKTKDESLANVLAGLPYSHYPNLHPELLHTLVRGQPGFTDGSASGVQTALEYCHYWLSMNFGAQPGYPAAPPIEPKPPRTQIILDDIIPNSEVHDNPGFALTCQSLGGTFEDGDVVYFGTYAKPTTFVDPQTLVAEIDTAAITTIQLIPIIVQSSNGSLKSDAVDFVIT